MSFSFGVKPAGGAAAASKPAFSFATPSTTAASTPAFSFATPGAASSTTPAASSSSLFGAPTTGATAGLGAAGTPAKAISAKSKFAELPDAQQQRVAELQNRITAQTRLAADAAHRGGAELATVRARTAQLNDSLATVRATLAGAPFVVDC